MRRREIESNNKRDTLKFKKHMTFLLILPIDTGLTIFIKDSKD